ncbi:tetratricopeptide repeat protein [candidate division CSSED10-310 bacterium]|uniref:Tetratricopeptide repeat protein n=1 Tax=candidate division CSSED10-310 bacterium TaxID=2855610 RepID=A0ABV6YZW0_UNCC1
MIIFTFMLLLTVPGQELPPSVVTLVSLGVAELNAAYDQWDITRFKASQQFFEKAIAQAPNHYLPYYWKGVTHFFMTVYYRYAWSKDQDKKQARYHIEAALEVLKLAVDRRDDDVESYALLATMTGMKIDIKPLTALWSGPQVMKYKDKAQAIDRDNPRANYLLGVSYYYGPNFMGGKDKSLQHLLRAERLFEKEVSQPKPEPAIYPRWGQSTCLVFIARLYSNQGDRKQALVYYRKALAANPADLLAKKELAQMEGSNK